MPSTEVTFDQALRALAAEQLRQETPEHPEPDVLLAYHSGELPAGRREQVRRHLVLCPPCAQLVLDLAAFPDLPAAAGDCDWSEDELAAERQALHRRLAASAVLPFPAPSRPAPRWLPAAAAALLALALGLGFWVVRLQQQLARLDGPVTAINLQEHSISYPGSQRGGDLVQIAVPAGSEGLKLSLKSASAVAGAAHQLVIRDAAGREVARRDGLVPDEDGWFSLVLALDRLVPGRYRVEIWQHDGAAAPAQRLDVELELGPEAAAPAGP